MFRMEKILLYFKNKKVFTVNRKKNSDAYFQLGFGEKIKENYWTLDSKGLPLSKNIKGAYNPTAICGYGFGLLELHEEEQKPEYLEQFRMIADWLVQNQSIVTLSNIECGVWYYYDKNPPWISAIAQGQAISVLMRAFKLFGADLYVRAAALAMNSFYVDTRDNGIMCLEDNAIFLEEYPNSEYKHVLNGFVYAIIGIWDYYSGTGDKASADLFNRCIGTLIKNLHSYDCGYWTCYSLPFTYKRIASRWYHQIHISMMQILFDITGEELFSKYATKWDAYDQSISCRICALIVKLAAKTA